MEIKVKEQELKHYLISKMEAYVYLWRLILQLVALILVCINEYKLLRDIENLLKFNIPKKQIDGFLPDPTIKAMPEDRVLKHKGRSRRSSKNKLEANQDVWGRTSKRSF